MVTQLEQGKRPENFQNFIRHGDNNFSVSLIMNNAKDLVSACFQAEKILKANNIDTFTGYINIDYTDDRQNHIVFGFLTKKVSIAALEILKEEF